MATVTDSLTTTYTYDAAANLISTTLPSANGYVETRTYDTAGRLTEVKNTKGANVLSKSTYTLDPVGNRASIVTTTGTTTLTYDENDRLTQACYTPACTGSDNFRRYTYDDVGNRLTEVRAAGTTSYVYDAFDQLNSSSGFGGNVAYSYDLNGSQTAAGSRTFTYDMARRTKTTTLSSTTTTYTYDGDGLRIKASTGSQAAKNTIFLWDSNRPISQLVRETDGNNALLREYQYGLDRVSMRVGSSAYFFHHDGLGSVVNVTSSTGVAQWTYQYHPYGTARTTTKNNNQAPANLTQFAGQYLDPTGLYHLRARHYDPVTGRFTAIDPVPPVTGQPCSSTYAYARNNPIGLVDPTGRESQSAYHQRNLLDQFADVGPCDPLKAVSGFGLIVLGGFEIAVGLLGIGAAPVTAGTSAVGSWILITSGTGTTIAGTARFMEGWNDCGVIP